MLVTAAKHVVFELLIAFHLDFRNYIDYCSYFNIGRSQFVTQNDKSSDLILYCFERYVRVNTINLHNNSYFLKLCY